MLLNELHPNAQFEIVSENGEQYNKYTTAVTIDGQRLLLFNFFKFISNSELTRILIISDLRARELARN